MEVYGSLKREFIIQDIPAIGLFCIVAQTPLGIVSMHNIPGNAAVQVLARSCYRTQHDRVLVTSVAHSGALESGAKQLLHARCPAIRRRPEPPSLIVLPSAALASGSLRSAQRVRLSRRHRPLC